MKQVLKYAGYILILFLTGYFLWKFNYLIFWMIVAAVLSFMGQPLVRFFDSIRIRSFRMPHALSALLSLFVIVIVFLGLIAVFVPLIISQAETISRINVNELAVNLQGPLEWIDRKMHELGAISDGQTLQDFLVLRAKSLVNLGTIGTLAGNLVSVAGSIFIGLFSILFIAFFFLKDEHMFENMLMLFIPEQHHQATKKVIRDSKQLLVRYYIGVMLELLGVMTLITLGLLIFGVKNALLIGFFGGLMNIIPYLGPVIGSVIGIILGITSTLAAGLYSEILPNVLKLAGVFLAVNFIDNNILVPVIYSKSVKSHPLEIFLVIIIGGGLAGLLGMLLAVPVYTLLRVIAREFFQQFRVIKKLTENIESDGTVSQACPEDELPGNDSGNAG
ncbi:MAG: AI-2E family transporter [Bacteroidales bacterium]|jgi:predicted PurR-regulated permease PerM|nr:AI-2E family transporter [Bacteroidales bacterium]